MQISSQPIGKGPRIAEARTTTITGWGRATRARSLVLRPASRQDVAPMLAASGSRGIVPRGLGRGYGDVALNSGGSAMDMTQLARIIKLDPGRATVEVEAGASIAKVIDAAMQHGLFVPVTPGTRWVTIGGAIAADVHGKNHHRDGSFGRYVCRLELALPSGETRVIERGSAEFAATVGGIGLTGVIVSAELELIRVPSAEMTVDVEPVGSLPELMARMAETDNEYRYSVAWVDTAPRAKRFGRGVLLQGDHAPASDHDTALRLDHDPRLRIPPQLSASAALRSRMLQAFNELYYHRNGTHNGVHQPIDAFFYPLDAVGGWNRLYGASGFLQYQFVVPFEQAGVVHEVLGLLRDVGAPMTLTVLKRLGSSEGLISFTGPGWTVAIDIALPHESLDDALRRADALIAAAGGSIYLAKDARLTPELSPTMLPKLKEWRTIRNRLDPDRVMQSDLARRLRLIEDYEST